MIPEVAAYELSSAPGRAVVVIRVSESDRTPHAVDGRRKIYVRVDSQTQPHLCRLATLDEIEWLMSNREKGERFIASSIAAARVRAEEVLSGPLKYWKEPANQFPTLDVWVAPRFYSGEQCISTNDLKSLLTDQVVRVSIGYEKNWGFPVSTRRRSVPMGYCAYTQQAEREGPAIYDYFELTTSGISYAKTRVNTIAGRWQPILPLDWVLCQVDGLLKYSVLFYDEGSQNGLIRVRASLSRLKDVVLQHDRSHRYTDLKFKNKSFDESIDLLDRTLDVHHLEEHREALVKDTAARLLWAFGYNWDEEALAGWWSCAYRT
jgi:hypothetical protein